MRENHSDFFQQMLKTQNQVFRFWTNLFDGLATGNFENWKKNLIMNGVSFCDYNTLEKSVHFQIKQMFDNAVRNLPREYKIEGENPLYDLIERFAREKPNWNSFPIYNEETDKVDFYKNENWLNGNEPKILHTEKMADFIYFKGNQNPILEKKLRPVLVIPPMSGHYSTLLRRTVKNINEGGADVFLIDWKNIRDVDLEGWEFGLEEYIENIIQMLDIIKQSGVEEFDIKSVCQPCPLTIAALSLVSEYRPDLMPKNAIFVAGPLKVSVGKTDVNRFAESTTLGEIEESFIKEVSREDVGAGQSVHMGILQTFGFMNGKIETHQENFNEIARLWAKAKMKGLEENEMRKFLKMLQLYYEYFATMDLPGKFDLETIKYFFQERLLEKGEFTFNFNNINSPAVKILDIEVGQNHKVDTNKIKGVNMITVEGDKDDITGNGQTREGVNDLFPHLTKKHFRVSGGHYGTFDSGEAFVLMKKILDEVN